MYLFPNVNMQDLNLDWILNQIKEMAASISDQAGKNAQALALTVEQSTLMKGFLGYFPTGTFSWTEDEHGIITSITVLKPINEVIDDVCDAWLAVQGQSIQDALNDVNKAKDRAIEASERAEEASSMYTSIKAALLTALDMLHEINNSFNANYVFQYLDASNVILGKGYRYNTTTGKIEIIDYNSNILFPPIFSIPAGAYRYASLYQSGGSHGSTYIEDISTGQVHELTEWVNSTNGTIYVPFNFNLYATSVSNDNIKYFISGINTTDSSNFGMRKWGSSKLDEIMLGFRSYKQYMPFTPYESDNTCWAINANGRLTIVSAGASPQYHDRYIAMPALVNLDPGTYTYGHVQDNYSYIQHGDTIEKLRTFMGASASSGTFTIMEPFSLFLCTTVAYATGSGGSSMYVVDGDGSVLPPPLFTGTYKNTFSEVNEALSTISELSETANTAPLYMRSTCYTVGHQGNQILAPRNTAPAYIIARRMGCLAGENDLQITSDNKFVMYHGGTLMYTNAAGKSNLVTLTGKDIYIEDGTYYYLDGSDYKTLVGDETATVDSPELVNGSSVTISNTTYEILSKISFGACHSEKYTSVGIMTFEEYVLLSKKLGLGINLDNKISDSTYGPYGNGRLGELMRILKAYGMNRLTRWGSALSVINDLRDLDPEAVVSVGLSRTIPGQGEETLEQFITRANGLVQYNTDHNILFSAEGTWDSTTNQAVIPMAAKLQKAHELGFDVSGYIIQTGLTEEQYRAVMNALVEAGVISITCDNHTVADLYKNLLYSW